MSHKQKGYLDIKFLFFKNYRCSSNDLVLQDFHCLLEYDKMNFEDLIRQCSVLLDLPPHMQQDSPSKKQKKYD